MYGRCFPASGIDTREVDTEGGGSRGILFANYSKLSTVGKIANKFEGQEDKIG